MPETQSQNVPQVLVVDDEKVMQDVMRDILEDAGYKVDVESNGEGGLARLKNKEYAVVFADIRMPKIDGMEFLRRAKHLMPDIEVIMMTGFATVDIAVEAMKLGALDFITKPFNLDHIRIVAARAIERTMLKKQAQEGEYYKKISLTDGLTELYNRRYFHQLLSAEINRSKRTNHTFCLLMIDADDFKSYNDTWGHPAGDEAVRFLAWLLSHHARISDMVCRYGGEEFSIILPETNLEAGKMAAERLRRIVEEAEFDRQEVMRSRNLTVSIGAACYPEDGQTAEEIVRSADQAMYQAKVEGKNRIVAWSEMQRSVPAKAKHKSP